MSRPTTRPASAPPVWLWGESLVGKRSVNPRGLQGCKRRTWVGSQGPQRKGTGGVCAGRERGSQTESLPRHPSPPPPGLFPRKLYQCGHAGRRHLGRLVSRCRGEEAGFSCVAAGRGGTADSPAPGLRRLCAPAGAPLAPPRPGRLQPAQGHILPRRRSRLLPPITLPFLSSLTAHSVRGGGGAGGAGRTFSSPFSWAFKTISK